MVSTTLASDSNPVTSMSTAPAIDFDTTTSNSTITGSLTGAGIIPTQNSLTKVESTRIASVLESVNNKLDFLGSITPDVMAHRDELSKFVGEEISRNLIGQKKLENRYEELVQKRAALKGLTNKSKYKELQLEIQAVSHALRSSTNDLCQSLKENPNISGNLLKIQREREDLMELFKNLVRENHNSGMFTCLLNRIAEEKRNDERWKDTVNKERIASAAVQRVESELKEEVTSHYSNVNGLEARISQLKVELREIKIKTAVDTKYARREARANSANLLRSYEQEEKELEAKLEELTNKMESEKTVHDDLVNFLENANKDLLTNIDKWSVKKEVDFAKMCDEFEAVKNKREEALSRLEVLRTKRRKEIAEAKAKEEEEIRQKEMEKANRKLERKKQRSATLIQRQFRDFLIEKAEAEALKAASKGGKGKGKKGK